MRITSQRFKRMCFVQRRYPRRDKCFRRRWDLNRMVMVRWGSSNLKERQRWWHASAWLKSNHGNWRFIRPVSAWRQSFLARTLDVIPNLKGRTSSFIFSNVVKNRLFAMAAEHSFPGKASQHMFVKCQVNSSRKHHFQAFLVQMEMLYRKAREIIRPNIKKHCRFRQQTRHRMFKLLERPKLMVMEQVVDLLALHRDSFLPHRKLNHRFV